jgi:Rrf2 family protein
MKISTKGRYALRMMIDIARQNTGEWISIKDISERQGISLKYLEQIVTSLTRSGLLISSRGPQGGYMLAKHPETITVADIFNVLEGPIEISDCVIEDESNCSKMGYCATRLLWIKISDSINQVTHSISLQDMLNDYNEMKNSRLKMEVE